MKRFAVILLAAALSTSCSNKGERPAKVNPSQETQVETGEVLIARDIVTEVIVKPSPEGDPWEAEKVAGYNGEVMINAIFNRIYDNTLTVYDYHSGQPLSADDVRDFEKEFNNDRTRIGKLSFTEDWYYNTAANSVRKVTRSVVFGYENPGDGGRMGYIAAFRADLGGGL